MTHSSCDRAQGDRLAFCWAFDTFSICKNRAGLKLDGSALLGWKWGSVCLTRVILLMLTAGLDYINHINPHAAATVEIKGCWILISWEAKNLCWFKFTKWHCWESVGNLVVLLRFLSDKNKTTNCIIYSHRRTHIKSLRVLYYVPWCWLINTAFQLCCKTCLAKMAPNKVLDTIIWRIKKNMNCIIVFY